MKPIKYPLEAFVWQLYDQNGNAQVEIRDANRHTVFFMRINGRELQCVDRLKNELAPMVVELLNKQVGFLLHEERQAVETVHNTLESIGNGSNLQDQPIKRGRGRPRKNG